jgi:uncharacterized protein YndB with AHSA1/START domain
MTKQPHFHQIHFLNPSPAIMTQQALGAVTKETDGTFTLRFERHYSHSIDRVWQAISDPAQIALWFGELRKPYSAQGTYELYFSEGNSSVVGTVRTIQPKTLLEYTWEHVTVPATIVRWELSEEGPSSTKLLLVHSQLRKNMHAYAGGWHLHLDLMEEVIEGRQTPYVMPKDKQTELTLTYSNAVKAIAHLT